MVGPYGGYLVPEDSDSSSNVGGGGGGDASGLKDAGIEDEKQEQEQEEQEEQGGKRLLNVTLPYVAQDNLELLTVDLVERCLDSNYKGGDLLGQHPDTGEDVGLRCGWFDFEN